MAEGTDKVMKLVERELQKNPDVSNQELYEKAKKTDASVGKLSIRQFHAKYPLQVKRKLAPRRPRRSRQRRKEPMDRDAVREILLRFARDLAAATGTAEVIDLYNGLDSYVDEVAKAAGKG